MLKENRIYFIGLLALFVYGWNFWGTSIYMLDEVKNAWCAYEMMQNGNLVVPVFNTEYHDKPGLQYFFMQLAYLVFGVNPFSARLFSVLFGVATVVLTYWFADRHTNGRVAVFTALSLIASLQLAMQFKMSVPDPYLIFFTTAAFISFYEAYSQQRRSMFNWFYAFIGLGFFAKGPISIVLPGLAVLLFLLFRSDLKWKTMQWILSPVGIFFFVFTGLPWYVWSGLNTNWNWPTYFFFTHNIDRYLNTFEGHGGFPLDTFVILFAGLLPLSVFLPQTVSMVWRERKQNPLLLFLSAIVLSFCIFFLFSQTVLPGYVAPALPFGAIALALYLDRLFDKKGKILSAWASISVLFIVALALVGAAFIALPMEKELKHLVGQAAWVMAILPVGVLIAFYLLNKGKIQYSITAVLVSFIACQLFIFGWLMPQADKANPVSSSLDLIQKSGKPIAYFQRINPAYVFQLGKTIKKLDTKEDVADFVDANGQVLIISTLREWKQAEIPGFNIVFQKKDLYESSQTVILSNQLAQ